MKNLIENLKKEFDTQFVKLIIGILELYPNSKDGHGKEHIVQVITNTLEYISIIS